MYLNVLCHTISAKINKEFFLKKAYFVLIFFTIMFVIYLEFFFCKYCFHRLILGPGPGDWSPTNSLTLVVHGPEENLSFATEIIDQPVQTLVRVAQE